MKNNHKKLTDLELFKSFFGLEAHKISLTKIEYRVQNLDGCMQAARSIIEKNRLNLVAFTSGNMAQIRAFEVKEVKKNG